MSFGHVTVIEGLPESAQLDALLFVMKDRTGRTVVSDGTRYFVVLVRDMKFTKDGIEWMVAFEEVAHGGAADVGEPPSTGGGTC